MVMSRMIINYSFLKRCILKTRIHVTAWLNEPQNVIYNFATEALFENGKLHYFDHTHKRQDVIYSLSSVEIKRQADISTWLYFSLKEDSFCYIKSAFGIMKIAVNLIHWQLEDDYMELIYQIELADKHYEKRGLCWQIEKKIVH